MNHEKGRALVDMGNNPILIWITNTGYYNHPQLNPLRRHQDPRTALRNEPPPKGQAHRTTKSTLIPFLRPVALETLSLCQPRKAPRRSLIPGLLPPKQA